MSIMSGRKVFFDMDGVLNVWEVGTHIDVVAAPGYMKRREPIRSMVEASRLLSEKGYEVWVASAVLPYEHSIPDKKYWLEQYCPWIPDGRQIFIPYGTEKSKILQKNVDISSGDVFLDDYTQNLEDLRQASLSLECVKVLNGINDTHHSWDGSRISIYSSPENIAKSIAAMSEFNLT